MELLEGVERSCLGCGEGEEGIIVYCFYEFGFTIFAVPEEEEVEKLLGCTQRYEAPMLHGLWGADGAPITGCEDGANRPLW